jgi:hypothetical protein
MFPLTRSSIRTPVPTAALTQPPAPSAQRATLSREISEFLIELSIGVHRYAMYPPGHPSLRPAVENLVLRMSRLLESRASIDIGVAHDQLVIEGVATEARHPVLSDLARTLHGHQLAALSLSSGVGIGELEELLALLAEESDRDAEPIGLRDPSTLPAWNHVRLHRVGYGELELSRAAGEGEGDPAQRLWLSLAQAALAGSVSADAAVLDDASAIARSISDHPREEAYDQVIVGYMLQIADELKRRPEAEAVAIRRRVTELVKEMDPASLRRLVSMGGDPEARRNFVLNANEALSVDAVMKILESSAAVSEQTISTSMTRLLGKLSMHAERGAGSMSAQAGSALRESVEKLLDGWELTDPNPDQYTRVLDRMAKASPLFRARIASDRDEEDTREVPGPVRLLRMAIEVDAYGPTVEAAVLDLLDSGGGEELFGLLERAPEGSEAATAIRRYLTSPDRVRAILGREGLTARDLVRITDELGPAAIDPLLDVLLDSDFRAVRRRVFDHLSSLGEAVRAPVMARLRDAAEWYHVRNLVSLLASVPGPLGDLDVRRWLTHEDARVRREAVPLALRSTTGATRARAIVSALSDADERVVRLALVELRSGVPDSVLPTLVTRVVQGKQEDEVRVLAIRLLRTTQSRLVREALLDLVVEGKSLLGKFKLADRTPVSIAALETLAETFADDPEVAGVIAQAKKSRDPVVRSAVSR